MPSSEKIVKEASDRISSYFHQWGNSDTIRGPWQGLVQKKALKIFESLHSNTGKYGFPTSVHYEITNRCNSRCQHCHRWTWKENQDPTIDEINNALAQMRILGVETLTIGGGEPLLHNDIKNIIVSAATIGFKVGLITNGIFLDESIIKTIINHAEWIRISIDATDEKIYGQTRGIEENFDRVKFNIKSLISARGAKSSKLQIGINYVVQSQNTHHIKDMVDIAEEWGLDKVLFKVSHGQGEYLIDHQSLKNLQISTSLLAQDSFYSTKSNLVEFNRMINDELNPDDIVSGYPTRSFYQSQKMRCFVPLFFLSLDPSGYAYPCDYLLHDTRKEIDHINSRNTYRLGNFHTHVAEDIVLYEKAQKDIFSIVSPINPEKISECGCCTRFYRFNKLMNLLYAEYEEICARTDYGTWQHNFRQALHPAIELTTVGWL